MSSVDILVPDLPESILNATITVWHKKPGNIVQRDEVLVEIETDKVVLEILAPSAGILETLLEDEGALVTTRQVLGRLRKVDTISQVISERSQNHQETVLVQSHTPDLEERATDAMSLTIRRHTIAEQDIGLEAIENKNNNTIRDLAHENIEKRTACHKSTTFSQVIAQTNINVPLHGSRKEKRVPMTRLRKCVAERLLKAKNSTAMLTTFNEVNMQSVIDLRKRYGDEFEKRHGIRLGLMSFYIKAALEALKRFPEVNASIDGEDIVYHNYFDVSIAVSTPRGLVTPVLKDVDVLGMADIENKIKELATKGREGTLTVEELTGGNFTITNGGVFGSLMSTPIINPPQSAIIGMHAIKDRPMAMGGQVVILPMMYVALSYDHRLIDGKESTSFLDTVKSILEEPIRLILDV